MPSLFIQVLIFLGVLFLPGLVMIATGLNSPEEKREADQPLHLPYYKINR